VTAGVGRQSPERRRLWVAPPRRPNAPALGRRRPGLWAVYQAAVPPPVSLVAACQSPERDALRLGTPRPLRQRRSRPGAVGTGLAACPFRWDEGRLLSPRRPSPGLSKDQVAVVLDGDQRVQGLPARLDTRGNSTGENPRALGPLLGGVAESVLALAHRHWPRARREVGGTGRSRLVQKARLRLPQGRPSKPSLCL